MSFQITKQGVNVTLTLKGPAGENLFTANIQNREQGVETLSLVAQTAGPHTLVIRPEFEKSPPGRYHLRVDELRGASGRDRRCFMAQQAFAEADQLFKKETAESRREALKELSESLEVWQSVEDRIWEARTLHRIGVTHFWLNEYPAALDHLNRALELRRATGDTTGEAEVLRDIGMVHVFKAESKKAIEHFNQALELLRESGERWQSAFTFYMLSQIYSVSDENEKASHSYVQALRRFREVGDIGNEAVTLAGLGLFYFLQGDYQSALDSLQGSLSPSVRREIVTVRLARSIILAWFTSTWASRRRGSIISTGHCHSYVS